MNRPNKQFYQMIEEYRETVEKVPLSLSDPVSRLAAPAFKTSPVYVHTIRSNERATA